MQNVLLLIDNDIAAVREFERLADLMLQTSDLRPVMFIQENMYFRMHVGVPAFCAERGIEVLTAASVNPSDGAAALGTQGSAVRRWLARFVAETAPKFARPVVSLLRFRRLEEALDNRTILAVRDVMVRRAAVVDAVLSERRYSALAFTEDKSSSIPGSGPRSLAVMAYAPSLCRTPWRIPPNSPSRMCTILLCRSVPACRTDSWHCSFHSGRCGTKASTSCARPMPRRSRSSSWV